MAKISLNNIIEGLAAKSGITRKSSDHFMRTFVDTIEKGLQEDGIVKIKGLGTFKLQEVNDRGSIDVNTGERITIKGYRRVTFTPDSAMKEFINRPFAHFEPTELNDGYPIEGEPMAQENSLDESEDIENDTAEEIAEEDVETPVEEVVEEPVTETVEEVSSMEEPVEETVEPTMKPTLEDTAEEAVKGTTEELPEENAEEVIEEAPEEITEEIVEETSEETAEAIIEDIAEEEVTEEASEEKNVEEATFETTEEEKRVVETTAEEVPEIEEISEEPVEKVAESVETVEEPASKEEASIVEEPSTVETPQPTQKRKKRRGGCLWIILLLLIAFVDYYLITHGVIFNEEISDIGIKEQSTISVKPNLQEELNAEWNNESKSDTPKTEEKKETVAPAATEPVVALQEQSPQPDAVEKTQATVNEIPQAQPPVAQTPEVVKSATEAPFCAVTLTPSLASKPLKTITMADTTDYIMNGTLVTHELKEGETIIQLAKKYYGEKRLWPYIVKYNAMKDFNNVAVGQKINIPILK